MEPSVSREEYWKAHIEECSRSGESQHDYCRRCNLALSTFGYWKRKLAAKSSPIQFYPVVIPPEKEYPAGQADISCFVGKHRRFLLEIKEGFSENTLRRIVAVLESV